MRITSIRHFIRIVIAIIRRNRSCVIRTILMIVLSITIISMDIVVTLLLLMRRSQ